MAAPAGVRPLYRDPSKGFPAGGSATEVFTAGAWQALGYLDGAENVGFYANNSLVRGVATPTQAQDAATKAYVDSLIAGFTLKDPVRLATTAGVGGTYASTNKGELSGMSNKVDNINLVAGDRILVKNGGGAGNALSANGIYVVITVGTGSNGLWRRSTDACDNGQLKSGNLFVVNEGDANHDTLWLLTSDVTIIIGTTNFSLSQLPMMNDIIAGNGLTKTGNQIDVGAGAGISVGADDVSVNYDGTLQIVTGNKLGVKTGNGLTTSASGVEANLDSTTGGMKFNSGKIAVSGGQGILTSGSVSVDIDTATGGLKFNTNKIAVSGGDGIVVGATVAANIDTAAGLKFDASTPKKIQVSLLAAGGLQFTGGATGLKLDNTTSTGYTGSGLELANNGVRLSLNTSNATLRMVSNKVDVKYDTTRALNADASGLYVAANTSAGLTFNAGALNVKVGGGLKFDGSGNIVVDYDSGSLALSGNVLRAIGVRTVGGNWKIDGNDTWVSAFQLNVLTSGDIADGDNFHYHGQVRIQMLRLGEAVAKHDVLCAVPGDWRVYKARADTDSKATVIGLAMQAGAFDEDVPVAPFGFIDAYLPGNPATDVGKEFFLGATGGLTTTYPTTGRVVRVGYQLELGFMIDKADWGRV